MSSRRRIAYFPALRTADIVVRVSPSCVNTAPIIAISSAFKPSANAIAAAVTLSTISFEPKEVKHEEWSLPVCDRAGSSCDCFSVMLITLIPVYADHICGGERRSDRTMPKKKLRKLLGDVNAPSAVALRELIDTQSNPQAVS